MERVSSQLTIFIRIALPTIWLTTIISFAVLLGFAVSGRAYIFSNPLIWIVLLFILGSGLAFIKYVLWRVYRVDMDNRFVYISDYLRTFKYPWNDVENIRDSKFMPGRVFIIRLKSKGTFGREVAFLASQRLWSEFIAEHPHLIGDLYSSSKK